MSPEVKLIHTPKRVLDGVRLLYEKRRVNIFRTYKLAVEAV
jgi:hypothetical protein